MEENIPNYSRTPCSKTRIFCSETLNNKYIRRIPLSESEEYDI